VKKDLPMKAKSRRSLQSLYPAIEPKKVPGDGQTNEIRPGNPGKQKTLRGEDLPTKALNEFFTAV